MVRSRCFASQNNVISLFDDLLNFVCGAIVLKHYCIVRQIPLLIVFHILLCFRHFFAKNPLETAKNRVGIGVLAVLSLCIDI